MYMQQGVYMQFNLKDHSLYESRRSIVKKISYLFILPNILFDDNFFDKNYIIKWFNQNNIKIDTKPIKFEHLNEFYDKNRMTITTYKEIISLNSVGTFIWMQINGINSIEDIAKQLHLVFSVNIEIATSDTLKFIDKLHKNTLVTFS